MNLDAHEAAGLFYAIEALRATRWPELTPKRVRILVHGMSLVHYHVAQLLVNKGYVLAYLGSSGDQWVQDFDAHLVEHRWKGHIAVTESWQSLLAQCQCQAHLVLGARDLAFGPLPYLSLQGSARKFLALSPDITHQGSALAHQLGEQGKHPHAVMARVSGIYQEIMMLSLPPQ